MSNETATTLTAPEVRARAVSGVVSVALRNVSVRLIGLVGTIVLARLLAPSDFGVLALGLTIRMFGSVLASAGLGASLLRRADPPTRAELEAVQGFQLAATVAVAVVVGVAGLAFGGAVAVAAVTVASLPIGTASGPSRIVLERDLNWSLLSRVEISSTVVYQASAVLLVVVGLGVYGVALAAIVEATLTLAVLVHFGPVGLTRPRPSVDAVRPLLRFGLQTQAVSLVTTVRDQGLNTLIAAVGGVAVLGIWSITFRLLQAVTLFLAALQRVAYPTLARAIAAGEDAGRLVNKSMRLNAIALGVPAVFLGATAPAFVPLLLGDKWQSAVDVLPLGAAAVLISAPVTSVGIPFLQAVGDGAATIRVVGAQTASWLLVAAVAVPLLGAPGAGVGMLAGAVALTLSVRRAAQRHARITVIEAIAVPDACAFAAGALGWQVARFVGSPLPGLVGSAALSLVTYLALMRLLRPDDVRTLWRLLLRGLRRTT